MALPSNTDWDLSYDEYALSSGSQIKAAVPLKLLQNMDYSVRCKRMLASHVWPPYQVNSGSYTEVFSALCYGPNVLGTSASTDIAGAVKAWATDAATGFSVRVYNASYGTLTFTIAAGASANTPGWRGWMTGTFTAPGDDTQWAYTVDAKRDGPGSGNIVVAGVGLFY